MDYIGGLIHSTKKIGEKKTLILKTKRAFVTES
jgi:hypothetical protein